MEIADFDVEFASNLLSINADDEFILISEDNLNLLFKICYDYITSRKFSRIHYLKIRQQTLKQWNTNAAILPLNLTLSDFDRIFSGLLNLSKIISSWFGKYSNNISQLRQSILKQWKISEKIIDLLLDKFFHDSFQNKQPNLVTFYSFNTNAIGYRLISIKWQLNLAISDQFSSKILEPYLRLKLDYSGSDNQPRTVVFDCQVKQFYQLRFTIAWLLKELRRIN